MVHGDYRGESCAADGEDTLVQPCVATRRNEIWEDSNSSQLRARHSRLGNLSPMTFAQQWTSQQLAARGCNPCRPLATTRVNCLLPSRRTSRSVRLSASYSENDDQEFSSRIRLIEQ
jgi:hypothetical protein